VFTGLIADQSPRIKDKERIREARRLFLTLNCNALWAQAEAKRRRFTEAELGHMRAEMRDWERAEARAEAEHDAFAYG
jgi:hypothetical protein